MLSPPSNATVKGYLDQQRQRKCKLPSQDEQPIPSSGTHSHTIYSAILDPSASTGCPYIDLTGRFPVQSNCSANYFLVVYEYDSNAIIVQPLCNRTAPEIKHIFQCVVHYLNALGLRPRLHNLDNEASAILRDYLRSEEVEYQLVPPHIHRWNASEHAISTYKNHFIAGLSSTDPNFPLSNWCRLLPQANSPLISSAPLPSTPNFWPMPNSRVPSISHTHPSHPQEPSSSSMKNPPPATLGPWMVQMAGTLAQPSTITNAIASGYHAHTLNAL